MRYVLVLREPVAAELSWHNHTTYTGISRGRYTILGISISRGRYAILGIKRRLKIA